MFKKKPTPAAGTTVLITGAGSGIGKAIAHAAATAGYRVVVSDIDEAAARRVAEAIGATALPLDIRDEAAWEEAFRTIARDLGSVDILVNNAGIIHTGNGSSLTAEQHRHMMEVNYNGPMLGTLTALKHMRHRQKSPAGQQRPGLIFTICSMTSFLPLPGFSTYAASKHAVRAFHHCIALEEKHTNVDFTILHPPAVETPMLEQEKQDPSAASAFAEKSVTPESIAEVVINGFRTRPKEIVFPPFSGRVQRFAGSWPRVIHAVMPFVQASARRRLRSA